MGTDLQNCLQQGPELSIATPFFFFFYHVLCYVSISVYLLPNFKHQKTYKLKLNHLALKAAIKVNIGEYESDKCVPVTRVCFFYWKIISYSVCFATEGLLLESTLQRLSEFSSEAEFKYVQKLDISLLWCVYK